MKQRKVVVVYSGGLDSTVLLYHATEVFGKKNVEAVSFDYGSKHNKKELECAKWNANNLKIKHTIFDLSEVIGAHFKSALLNSGGDIPHGHYAAENMKETVVPLRNGIMLMIAAGYADSHGMDQVWIGAHGGDHAIYADCRVAFNRALNITIQEGTDQRVSIAAPFNDWLKHDIVARGKELNVPFEKTWSCYEGQDIPCWKCGTCVERKEAFDIAKVHDPLYTKKKITRAKKHKMIRDVTYNVKDNQATLDVKVILACLRRLKEKGIQPTRYNIWTHTRVFVNEDGTQKRRRFERALSETYKRGYITKTKVGHYYHYNLVSGLASLKRWIE